MHRHHALFRPLAHLALLAALLLALLPTAGRLLQPAGNVADDGGIGAYWSVMCSMVLPDAGVAMSPLAASEQAPTPAPMPRHDQPECAYCPLLAATLLVVLWFAAARPDGRRAPPRGRQPAVSTDAPYPCGLGSRGPPIAL